MGVSLSACVVWAFLWQFRSHLDFTPTCHSSSDDDTILALMASARRTLCMTPPVVAVILALTASAAASSTATCNPACQAYDTSCYSLYNGAMGPSYVFECCTCTGSSSEGSPDGCHPRAPNYDVGVTASNHCPESGREVPGNEAPSTSGSSSPSSEISPPPSPAPTLAPPSPPPGPNPCAPWNSYGCSSNVCE